MNVAVLGQAEQLRRLNQQPSDALLVLVGQYALYYRPHKIDLQVGVFKDEAGRTPVLAAVKAAEAAAVVQSNLLSFARANSSMPPKSWRCSGASHSGKRRADRTVVRGTGGDAHLHRRNTRRPCPFSTLPLSSEKESILREDHAIYMTGSGRTAICGLTSNTFQPFASALAAVR